jgi:hypothetical protein
MMIVLGNTVRIVNVLLSMASAVIGGWLQFNQPFRASQPFYTAGVLTLIYASLKRQADTGRSGNDA